MCWEVLDLATDTEEATPDTRSEEHSAMAVNIHEVIAQPSLLLLLVSLDFIECRLKFADHSRLKLAVSTLQVVARSHIRTCQHLRSSRDVYRAIGRDSHTIAAVGELDMEWATLLSSCANERVQCLGIDHIE